MQSGRFVLPPPRMPAVVVSLNPNDLQSFSGTGCNSVRRLRGGYDRLAGLPMRAAAIDTVIQRIPFDRFSTGLTD